MVDYSKWDKIDFSDDSEGHSDMDDGNADVHALQHMLEGDAPSSGPLHLRPDPQTPWLGLAAPDTAMDLPAWCRVPPTAFRPQRKSGTGEFGYWGLPDEDRDIEDIMRRLMSGVKYANADLDTPEAQYVKYLITRKAADLKHQRAHCRFRAAFTLRAALILRGDAGYRELEPSVWRRMRVGGGVRLRQLWEGIVRPAFQWARRYHAYLFRDGSDGAVFGPLDCNTIDMMHLSMHGHAFMDDSSVRVAELLREPGDHMFVTYDLGDGWEHRIEVEEVTQDASANGVHGDEGCCSMELLDGQGAGAPEDSNGLEEKGCQAYQAFLDQGARCKWAGPAFHTACARLAETAINFRGHPIPFHPLKWDLAFAQQQVAAAQLFCDDDAPAYGSDPCAHQHGPEAHPPESSVPAYPTALGRSAPPQRGQENPATSSVSAKDAGGSSLHKNGDPRSAAGGAQALASTARENDMKLMWSKFPELQAEAIMGAMADSFGEPDVDRVARMSGSECVAMLQRQIEELRFNEDTALLMRRIRARMEGGWDGETHSLGDIGVILHTTTRSAVTFRPNGIPVLEALGSFWRAPGVRRHLLFDNPLHSAAKLEIKEKFPHGLPHPCHFDPLEAAVLAPFYAARADPRGGHKPAYEYCFLYFNLLLGTALQGQPSMDSSRDGLGAFRTLPGPNTLTLTAARRVFDLWCDKGVRDSVGDAMAPAASFALSFYDRVLRRALLRIQNPRTGRDLRKTLAELWRPCPAEVAMACFDEMFEGSWSYTYGAQVVSFLVTHTLGGRDGDVEPEHPPPPIPSTEPNPFDDPDVTPRVFFGWSQCTIAALARLASALLHAVSFPEDYAPPPFARRAKEEGALENGGEIDVDVRDLALKLFYGALAPRPRRLRVLQYLENTFEVGDAVIPARARAFFGRVLRRHRDGELDAMAVDVSKEMARTFTPPPRGAGVDPILARLQRQCLERAVAALKKHCGGKVPKRNKKGRRGGKR